MRAPTPEGLLNMLKPPGMTSHDVVDAVRRILGIRRVGHAGTLDPAAAGVMIVMVGQATRLSEFLTAHDKTYRAEITLGVSTDTLDGEGVIVDRADAAAITAGDVEDALVGLTGELQIVPPMHSAIRHRGRRLYEIARAGGDVDVPTREVTVTRFALLDFEPGEQARALTEIDCSAGTYVRSLAAMLGERLGCGAYLSFLVRTRVGSRRVADALTGSELTAAVREGRLDEVLIRPQEALGGWPRVEVDTEGARQLCRGGRTSAPDELPAGRHALVMTGGRLLCVAEVLCEDGRRVLQPRRVMLPEDEL